MVQGGPKKGGLVHITTPGDDSADSCGELRY